jgi:hypothetical protein
VADTGRGVPIAWLRLSAVTLPLAVAISDAKVFTGRQRPMTEIAMLFVEVKTRDGAEGIGFSYSKRAGGRAQYAQLSEIADNLLGEDSSDIGRAGRARIRAQNDNRLLRLSPPKTTAVESRGRRFGSSAVEWQEFRGTAEVGTAIGAPCCTRGQVCDDAGGGPTGSDVFVGGGRSIFERTRYKFVHDEWIRSAVTVSLDERQMLSSSVVVNVSSREFPCRSGK